MTAFSFHYYVESTSKTIEYLILNIYIVRIIPHVELIIPFCGIKGLCFKNSSYFAIFKAFFGITIEIFINVFMFKNLQIMNQNINKLKKTFILGLFVVFAAFIFSSCTKEVPKDLLKSNEENKTPISQQQMPDDSIHRNLMKNNDMNSNSSSEDDEKLVETLTKEADDADAKYEKTKSEADKKAAIERQMEAANFLMFQADLPPKKKYRPALKRYRRVLELDPENKEAFANKKQIEDIYESMGRPIPN